MPGKTIVRLGKIYIIIIVFVLINMHFKLYIDELNVLYFYMIFWIRKSIRSYLVVFTFVIWLIKMTGKLKGWVIYDIG